MKALTYSIPLLLLSACGSLQETAMVQDDVYSIPDRKAIAAAAAQEQATDNSAEDAYYDPSEARGSSSLDRDYYDMTYNDPYYYNYGRFGFGSGIGGYGSGMGMGFGYSWPTSFGSMGIGYGLGYGYNPYWSNSWMSGYGYDPYGYYGYGNYGYGWGGYGIGYGPYQGPWGGCYGCYEPNGYGNTVYSHRPSMSAGSPTGTATAPRLMRNPDGLLPPTPASRNSTIDPGSSSGNRATGNGSPIRMQPGRSTSPSGRNANESRPSRQFDFGGSSSPSRSGGGDNGGGRISSPRPR